MTLEQIAVELRNESERLEQTVKAIQTITGSGAEGIPPAHFGKSDIAGETLTKLQYFNIFRDYRLAEYDLLNHRLTWNLAVQGFLFATYGFCIQKLAEIPNKNYDAFDRMIRQYGIAQIQFLMIIIPLVGILLSISVLFAVLGAQLVLKRLQKEWQDKVESNFPDGPYLVDPAGAGVQKVIDRGFWPPRFISGGFAFAWAAIVVFTIVRR